MVKCPQCHGSGNLYNPILWSGVGGEEKLQCSFCKGKGRVSQKRRMDYVRAFKEVFAK